MSKPIQPRSHYPSEYLVQVTIMEARELKGKDESGTSDPFVRITVGNLPPQVTTTAYGATSAVWNQSFTFTNLWMNDIEFEKFEILIEVWDMNKFEANKLIGGYSIGLATLYRSSFHEIYNTWLVLCHPDHGLVPQGYILFSGYIIGTNDSPPVHAINEIVHYDEEVDPYEGLGDEELTAEQLKERKERNKLPSIIGKPKMLTKSYQLMINLVKAEDLPALGISSDCDSFVSARCCGNVMITHVSKKTQNPQFYSRMCFPVEFPLYNDKVILRVWDKRIMASDIFISNIPEFTKENDFFSLSYLQSRGGIMPFRWFNLYGIPANERNSNFLDFIFSKKKMIEGTEYFGRVLLSLSLNSNNQPTKGVLALNAFREPPSTQYLLRVDAYELQGAKNCGNNIKIRVSVGKNLIMSEPAKLKKDYEKSKIEKQTVFISDAYEWKESKIMINEERFELPQDKSQIPDIIISLLTPSKIFGEYYRVAYFRVPAVSQDLIINKPKWYPLKSVENNLDPGIHSYLLLNISLMVCVGKQQIPRIPILRNVKGTFIFAAFLYCGMGLDPESGSEDIQAEIDIRIAHFKIKLKKPKHGRNPIWNERLLQYVEIDENLEFASNIIVTVSNPKSKLHSMWNIFSSQIGELCLSASECRTSENPLDLTFKPKFRFYALMKDGLAQGKILGAFHLYKMKKKRTLGTEELERAKKAVDCSKIPITLSFAVLGIRNLPSPIIKGCLILRIPIEDESSISLFSVKEAEESNATNIAGNKTHLKFISSSYAEIKIPFDSSNLLNKMGTNNPNFMKMEKIRIDLPSDPLFHPICEVEFQGDGYFQSVFIAEIFLYEYADFIPLKKKQEALSIYEHVCGLEMDGVNDNEEIPWEKQKENKERVENEGSEKKNSVHSDNHPLIGSKRDLMMTEVEDEDEGVDFLKDEKFLNADIGKTLEIEKTLEDKRREDEQRKLKIEKLKKEINEIKTDDINGEMIRRDKNAEILFLNRSKTTHAKFQISTGGIQEDFSYGRKVEKGDISQHYRLPYQRYKLKELSYFTSTLGSSSYKVHQMSNGDIFLKAKFLIETYMGKSEPNNRPTAIEDKHQGSENKSAKEIESVSIAGKSARSKKSGRTKKGEGGEDEKYPFNIFDEKFLNAMKMPLSLKCRVYIYRGLNLSAQSNYVDIPHLLSGMEGKCSTNSYPEILVGSGKSESNDVIKSYADSNRAINQDLNPKYFRMYEMDPILPNDWNLEIRIWDKQLMSDALIGSAIIDIEDRLYGQPELKQRIAYQIYKEYFEQELNKLKFVFEKKNENDKIRLQKDFNEVSAKLESFNKKLLIPVEYCALKNQDKNTSQGNLELFIEPFPLDVAKLIPASSIDPPQPLEFEIRLIVWETFNIARIRNTVDIFVRVTQESFGWVGDGVSKETDTHLGSEDGYGLFNWRMKFNLQIPCPFPRLRFSVYDMETLSSDESLGERVISFMKILKKLRLEGKYEMPPRRLKIQHPNFPDEDRGEILYSLNIISKQEADNDPVGEGQNEPNHDPYLEKPKIGRGIGDFLKGTAFDFSLWRFFGLRALKILLGMIFSLVVTMILFVKPGILVK